MINGLSYVPGYLTAAEQAATLACVDGQPWLSVLKRRVQHYGYRYDYTRRVADESLYLGPLPGWAAELAARLAGEGHAPAVCDQVIVNEYEPGQGISAHVDCVPCFGDTILSISLGSACAMVFSHLREPRQQTLWLEPGSLLVMRGPARYDWKHAIPARKTDLVDGETRPRGRRVSLTFRTVI
jgi:alkylated DNA repair dioxygenase AlkB